MLDEGWEKRWTAYLQAIPDNRTKTPAQLDTRRNRTQLHEGFSKATSALLTQIRTEKIGLNAFFTERKVPGYTPICPCGWLQQTAKHIIMNCQRYSENRLKLYTDAGTHDYRKMLTTARGAKAATTFLQGTGLLGQFQLGLKDGQQAKVTGSI